MAVKEWKPVREKTIPLLDKLADKIEFHYKNTNIARIAGAGTAIAGGALIVGGAVATFFTLGFAAPVVVGGVALAVGGGATVAGSSITDLIVSKLNLDDAQKQIDSDNEMTKKVILIINIIEAFVDNICRLNPQAKKKEILEILLNIGARTIAPAAEGGIRAAIAIGKLGEQAANLGRIAIIGGNAAQLGNVGVNFGRAIGWMRIGEAVPAIGEIGANVARLGGAAVRGGQIGIRVGEAAVQIGGGAARVGVLAGKLTARLGGAVFHVVGAAFEIVLLPLNIYDIVSSSISLANGSKTKASKDLREKATDYKNQMDDILKVASGDVGSI